MLNTSDSVRKAHVEGCRIITDEELKKLQQILLGMIDDIDDVMQANSIEYMLGGGSCLGAVRHDGFIPWDDDVDINITRSEFERFLPLFEEKYGDKYWIHIPGRTEGYALLFPQIRLKGTSVKTRDDFKNGECGVCIDFFFIENTYNDPVRRFFQGIGCQYYGFITSCRKFFRDRDELIDFANKTGDKGFMSAIKKKAFVGKIHSRKSIDDIVKKADRFNGKYRNDSSTYVTVPTGRRHFFGELRKRSVLLPSGKHNFEGRSLPVPNNPEEYLTKLYGSYKNIPDQNDREKHTYFEPFVI